MTPEITVTPAAARVLIVDDNPANLLALETTLEPLGHTIVRASSGEEALKQLLRDEFAVVLLDVVMPGFDGLQTAALMKQRQKSRGTPIIFLSAISNAPTQILNGYSHGAVDYLVKPFDPNVLRAKVSVFVDLYLQAQEIKRQAAILVEQERAAESLRVSERNYRILGESIPQQVWTSTPSGALDYVNDVVVRYFDRPAEEILGSGWQRFLHPEDLTKSVERWSHSLRTGEVYEVELRLRRADGEYRWHLGRAVPVRASDNGGKGHIIRWFGTNTDIDDQISIRRRAEESEQKFRTLTETMPQMCWSANPDGAFDYVNHQWLEYTGQSQEQALGWGWEAVHDPERLPEVVAHWKACLISGAAFEMEFPLRRASDGMFRLHLTRAAALRNAEGEIIKWFGTCTDIHEQRALVAERLQLEARERQTRHVALRADVSAALSMGGSLRQMLQRCCEALVQNPGGSLARIWTVDAAGALLELQGSAGISTDMDGPRSRVAVDELDLDSIAAELGLAAVAGYPIILGERGIGTVALFAQRSFEPDTLEVIEVVADMLAQGIERKRAEEELARRAAELARSNAELERFAYVASHDLQEPLRMVASYTQLLGSRYVGKLDQDADEFIGFAVDGVKRMETLISDLLAFSRVETKAGAMLPVPLARPLESALANLRLAVSESGAQLVIDPLPTVIADERQLIQLFQNLIANAIKFRDREPPRIHISAERAADDEWRINVRDNGIGIDPEFFDRLFVVFQRLHTRVEYPGNGIGLAICKKIVERHGGRIWVESSPGRGAMFSFTLRGGQGE